MPRCEEVTLAGPEGCSFSRSPKAPHTLLGPHFAHLLAQSPPSEWLLPAWAQSRSHSPSLCFSADCSPGCQAGGQQPTLPQGRGETRQQNCQCMHRESGWPSAGHLPLQLEGRGCSHAYQKRWQRPGRFAVAAARHSWGGWLITGCSLPASSSLPEHRVQHPGDRRAQRGQVVAHQLPAEAAPQKGYFSMVPGLREEPLAQLWSGRQGSALLASLTVSLLSPKGKPPRLVVSQASPRQC